VGVGAGEGVGVGVGEAVGVGEGDGNGDAEGEGDGSGEELGAGDPDGGAGSGATEPTSSPQPGKTTDPAAMAEKRKCRRSMLRLSVLEKGSAWAGPDCSIRGGAMHGRQPARRQSMSHYRWAISCSAPPSQLVCPREPNGLGLSSIKLRSALPPRDVTVPAVVASHCG
jgi:hypothetical protein